MDADKNLHKDELVGSTSLAIKTNGSKKFYELRKSFESWKQRKEEKRKREKKKRKKAY